MQVKFGGLLRPRVAQGEVSFTGPDSNGVVVWTFKNTGTQAGSWLLQRGASLGGQQFEDYVFGQAFNVVYLYNPSAFGTSLLQAPPTPLVDEGYANNSPPMAVVDAPSGRSICFIFTLAPGQSWSMEEGGFSNGVVPSNPVLIPVTVEDGTARTFCDAWNSEQCQGFNQQAGTSLPCPPNPWQISSILMQTSVSIPIIIQDTIADGPCATPTPGPPNPGSCTQYLDQLAADAEAGDLEAAVSDFEDFLTCLVSSGAEVKLGALKDRLERAAKKVEALMSRDL